MDDCLSDDNIYDLLSGQLATVQQHAAERHLDDCARCRRVVADTAAAGRRGIAVDASAADTAAALAMVASPATTDFVGLPPRLRNYRVARLLGAGAMGSVYLLEHVRLPNTFAAIKVLSPRRGSAETLRERFVQEAVVAATIGGDRIARPLDVGQLDDGTPYIIMEYVDGRTVAQALDADGPLPVARALAIAWSVGDTMALAHARGIIHRDLKPSNIMLVDERLPRVKVLDFGVARADGELKIVHTIEAAVIGSPGYMSPEAATGMAVDARTDVFSLGVTLFKMLTGALPFAGDNPQAILAATLTAPPLDPSALRPAGLDPVPREVAALIERALHRSAADRPDMCELRDRLWALLAAAAPEPADALRVAARSASALPAELDELGPTLPHTSDAAAIRRRAESFADARFGATRHPGPLGRRWPLVVAAVCLLLTGATLLWRTRAPTLARRPMRRPPVQRQVTTVGNVEDVALSPDAKVVAYSAGSRVYLHDLAAGDTRSLAAGAAPRYNVNTLRFDARGESLYFRRNVADGFGGARVSRAGGDTTALPWARSGQVAPSPDGRELAIIAPADHAVDIYNGEGALLRHLPVAGSYAFIVDVRWSPRGDRLLVVTMTHFELSAHILTPDGSRQELLPIGNIAEVGWFDNRSLLVSHYYENSPGDDLLLQPLDRDGFRIAGDPRLVLADLRGRELTVSPDGRSAVYIATPVRGQVIWSVTIDRDDKPHTRTLDFGTALTAIPRISPDGSRVAVSVFDGQQTYLVTQPFDGGPVHQVTRIARRVIPTWSPDSMQLAWRENSALAIAPADGGTPRKLPLQGASDDQTVVWPRADRVLYHVEGNRGWNAIDVATGAVEPLAPGAPGYFVWPVPSPDGSRIAVQWNRSPRGIWIVDLLSGASRFVGGPPLAVAAGWSSDGTRIYIKRDLSDSSDGPLHLEQLSATEGALRPWIELPMSNRAICTFARDGRRAICAQPVLHDDVWMIANFGELVDAARSAP